MAVKQKMTIKEFYKCHKRGIDLASDIPPTVLVQELPKYDSFESAISAYPTSPMFITRYGDVIAVEAIVDEGSWADTDGPMHSDLAYQFIYDKTIEAVRQFALEEWDILKDALGDNKNDKYGHLGSKEDMINDFESDALRYFPSPDDEQYNGNDVIEKWLENGLIRINPGTGQVEHRFYCVLPSKNIVTGSQWDTLSDFFEYARELRRDVLVFVGHQSVKFPVGKFGDEIVDSIKRYYRTGNFFESKKKKSGNSLTESSKDVAQAVRDYLDSFTFSSITRYDGFEDSERIGQYEVTVWSHMSHFGSAWESEPIAAIQIDCDSKPNGFLGYSDIESQEEYETIVDEMVEKVEKYEKMYQRNRLRKE